MLPRINLFVLLTLVVTPVLTLDVPSNVKDFYSFVRGRNKCKHALSKGFHSSEGDSGGTCLAKLGLRCENRC